MWLVGLCPNVDSSHNGMRFNAHLHPRRNQMAKKQKKTRKDSSSVTRRDVLKLGAAAGAVTALGPTIFTSRKAYAAQGVAEPIICETEPVDSPPHTPFVDNLPIPFPAIPVLLNP